MIDRLVEVLFIQAVGAWLNADGQAGAALSGNRTRAFADPQIGRALACIHQRPEVAWSVEALAHEAAMSRSTFYRRFGELLEESPASYLRRCRMSLATRWLASGERSIKEMAEALGYSGVPAFSRAFKESQGVAPTVYRGQQAA